MSVFEDIVTSTKDLSSRKTFSVLKSTTFLVDNFETKKASLRRLVSAVSDVVCPPAVLEGLQIDTELSLYWKHDDGTKRGAIGEFILPSPLIFMLESRLSDVFFDEKYDGVDLRNTRTIDYSGYTAKGIHALLEVKRSKLVDDVILFDERQVFRLHMTYLEYMALIRRTRGIEYWQLLYCDGIDKDNPRLETIDRGLKVLRHEFPEEDFSDLLERLRRQRG
jgi:hypothetical protein